jgi:hypothetical protein
MNMLIVVLRLALNLEGVLRPEVVASSAALLVCLWDPSAVGRGVEVDYTSRQLSPRTRRS